MNINIYDEASLTMISSSSNHQNHTISSYNKSRSVKKKYKSESELCSLKESISSKLLKPNDDMYLSGINFLKHKQEKQEFLSLQLEQQFKKQCTFSPQLSLTSRILTARQNNQNLNCSTNQDRFKSSLIRIDSQTQKLEKELMECTFSPKILKTTSDIFDRRKPMYERNVQWQEQIKEKQQQTSINKQSILQSNVLKFLTPKQLDLRAAHALKKNISMKYLKQSMIQ